MNAMFNVYISHPKRASNLGTLHKCISNIIKGICRFKCSDVNFFKCQGHWRTRSNMSYFVF